MIEKSIIEQIDKSNMFKILLDFPLQVKEALEIGEKSDGMPASGNSDYMILGMGGSAIGGSLLATYAASIEGLKHINIRVNRDYDIPGNLTEKTAVIASSYSGGTEETLSGLSKSSETTKNILCLTTGGKLGEIADNKSFRKLIIPSGMMPRCALGYSFFPMLMTVLKSSEISDDTKEKISDEIIECLEVLGKKSKIYSSLSDNNPALKSAERLKGKIPVIYSSNTLEAVNLRWRCQIQENSKNLAYGHVIPEMNHNEINSWSNPKDILNRFSVIMLNELSDNDKINARFDAVENILLETGTEVQRFKGEGLGLLSRMFDLIYLGDWISYYLAILNEEDPIPIPLISRLKQLLSE